MTTQTKKESNQLLTPVFRVSFPVVFKPKPSLSNPEDLKYSITMLFDIKDPETAKGLQEVKNAIRAAVVAKWGPDQAKWPKGLKTPLRKGEEKEYEGYGAGVVFATASSKMKPGLVDQAVQPIIDPNEFYGGCYARATISVFAYDKQVNKGVGFGLRNIQKVKDGEPFSGRSKPENDFDSIAVPASAVDGGAASGVEDLGI